MMKNWKRLPALLSAGAMLLSLCACKPGESGESPSPSAEASASAAPIVADLTKAPLRFAAGVEPGDALLTVNGEKVPADIVLYWLHQDCYFLTSQYGASVAGYGDMLRDDTVSLCVSEVVLRQQAAKLGCIPTDAQVKAARDGIAADPDTIELLKSGYGLTDSSIEYLALADAYYENILGAATHEPNEQELEQYLADQGAFCVKHILLKTVDDSDQPLAEDKIAEKKAQAEDLLAQLQAAEDMPAKFDELMKAHSEDGGLAAYPDGYVFDATASLVGGFREAALELEEGELSGIVETDYGYHIMLRQPLPDASKAQYRADLRSSALREQVDAWVKEAEIVKADALTDLDVGDFYARLNAYLEALMEQRSAAESQSVESGGVG